MAGFIMHDVLGFWAGFLGLSTCIFLIFLLNQSRWVENFETRGLAGPRGRCKIIMLNFLYFSHYSLFKTSWLL